MHRDLLARLLSQDQIVRGICEAVLAASDEEGHPPTLGGRAAHALLLHYATRAGIGDYAEGAASCLERACAGLAETTLGANLRGGFPGIAWTVQHLSGEPPADDDALEELDALLLEHVSRTPWDGDPEELTGIAVYALERLPNAAARRTLEQAVARLTIEPDGNLGEAWRTAPRLYATPGAPPTAVHSLGVAHGVPAVLCALAGAAAHGIDGARAVFEAGARWLWRQADRTLPFHFAHWLDNGVPAARRWPTWCSGDTGVAAAMLTAARAVGSAADEAQALDLAVEMADWTPARVRGLSRGELEAAFGTAELVDSFLDNPFICHGAAGNAHMFWRLHRASGDARFEVAARAWREELGRLAQSGDYRDGGLVNSAVGVALVLLAATTPIEPAWDRVLMLSLAAAG